MTVLPYLLRWAFTSDLDQLLGSRGRHRNVWTPTTMLTVRPLAGLGLGHGRAGMRNPALVICYWRTALSLDT